MSTELLAATVSETVLVLAVALVLFACWLYANFVLILDQISFPAKVGWFLALTLLAPISIPTYLFLRHRRRAERPSTGPGRSDP